MHLSLQHCWPEVHAPEPQHVPPVTHEPLQHCSPAAQTPPMPQQTWSDPMHVPLQHCWPDVHAPLPQQVVPHWPLQHISPELQQPPPHGLLHVVAPVPPSHALTAASASDCVQEPQLPVQGTELDESW
jgi:hypothetical protein